MKNVHIKIPSLFLRLGTPQQSSTFGIALYRAKSLLLIIIIL